MQLPAQALNLFGVKFYPWVAQKIWQCDMHYHTDQCLSLADLGSTSLSALQEEIYLAERTAQQIQLVESYLTQFLHTEKQDSLKHILSEINAMPSNLSFKNTGIGSRRLEQRFKNEIGISPKRFVRTIRINQLINQLKEGKSKSLTNLAYEYDYYDQSHFIRDFKQFTGLSPTKFLDSINPSGDIFNLRISA